MVRLRPVLPRGSEQGVADVAGARMEDGNTAHGEGESVNSAGDAASARAGDGSSAHQEGAYERRAVYRLCIACCCILILL